jgi:uncharacterized protein YqeY
VRKQAFSPSCAGANSTKADAGAETQKSGGREASYEARVARFRPTGEMSLKDRIQEDMKAAMRSGDKERLGTVRLIVAAIKQREVDERIALDDAQVLVVLDKMGKQRRESITQFQAGGRQDLVDKESAELKVIGAYLPAQLSDAELDALIAEAIGQTGAVSIKDMGKVMNVIKTKAQGRADMAAVGARIKARLSQNL